MNRLPLLCALLAACGGSSAHAPDAGAHDAGTHDAGVPDGGCSSKYDCVATQICVAGSCTAAASNGSCVADNGCPTGFICAAEMCAPGCVDNRDCRAPDVCNLEAAVCEAATVDAGVLVDAGTGLVDAGELVDGGRDAGEPLADAGHQDAGYDAGTGFGAVCGADAFCASHECCSDWGSGTTPIGYCTQSCTEDADCPSGAQCAVIGSNPQYVGCAITCSCPAVPEGQSPLCQSICPTGSECGGPFTDVDGTSITAICVARAGTD